MDKIKTGFICRFYKRAIKNTYIIHNDASGDANACVACLDKLQYMRRKRSLSN